MVLDEFLIDIESQFNNSGFKKVVAGIAAISASVLALNAGFESITKKFADLSLKAQATGDNMQDIQRWLNAGASSAFTNFENVKTALSSLQEQILLARKTGQIPISFQMAGINVNASPVQALEQLRSKISKMSASQGLFVAEQAGLKELYPLLKLSKEEFDSLSQTPILSQKQLNSVFQTTGELRKLKNTLIAFKDQLFASFAPFMGFVFKTINNTLLLILPIITGTINRISAFLRSLQQDIQAISKFLEKNKEILQRLLLVIGVGVVYKIKTVLALLTKIPVVGKIILGVLSLIQKHPIIFALTAILFVIEDIVRLALGHNSVIGTMFDKAKKAIFAVIDVLKSVKDVIYEFFIGALDKVVAVIDKIKNSFSGFKNFFSGNKTTVSQPNTDVYENANRTGFNFGTYNKTVPNSNVYNNNNQNSANNKNITFGNIILNVKGEPNQTQIKQIGYDLQKQIKTATYGY